MKLDIRNLFRLMKNDEINNDSDYVEAEPVAELALCDYCAELNDGAKWNENRYFELYCNAKNESAEQAFLCGFKTAVSLILSPDKVQQLDELSRAAFAKIKKNNKEVSGK